MSFDLDTKVYFSKKTYITYFKVDKTFQKVTSKYVEFRDIFLPKLFVKFSKHRNINNHIIELVYNPQLFYSLIYSLAIIDLDILKTYIKNNLANDFI